LGIFPKGGFLSQQPQLFYEDVFEVVKAAVQAAGGAKKVALAIWPAKPAPQAHKELLDCLNRESPRKLCIEEFMQVLKLAREAGFHQAKHWIDTELGYQQTAPLDPAVEEHEIATALRQHAENSARLDKRIEQYLARNQTVRVVK